MPRVPLLLPAAAALLLPRCCSRQSWCCAADPGNRTKGVEELDVEIKGSALWPTVTGESKHKAVIANGNAQFDIAKCNPSFVQVRDGMVAAAAGWHGRVLPLPP